MDSSFTIKPPPGARKSFAPRDPVTVREAVATDLDAAKTVTATHDGGTQHRHQHPDQHLDHAPQDLLADPDSRDVIFRERDVRGPDRQVPDQALQRLRAYGPPAHNQSPPPDKDTHADVKA